MTVLSDRPMRFARRGVILVWALVTMAVATTIVGGLAAYYTGVGRIANVYMQGTTARFAAQNLMDERLTDVVADVRDVVNAALALDSAEGGDAWKLLADTMKESLASQAFSRAEKDGRPSYVKTVGGQTLTIESPDALLGDAAGDSRTLVLETRYVSGGIPTVLRQEITFERKYETVEDDTVASSHPCFDYVYFVNNYGHLESDCIIANGNVHSNDRMTIADATVNGFVSAYSNTVTITRGKMWPEKTYETRIAAAYGRYLTQVRPVDGNPFAWSGGYLPPFLLNPYSDGYETVEAYPTVIAPTWPGTKPTFTETAPSQADYLPSAISERTWKTGGLVKITHHEWTYTYDGRTVSSGDIVTVNPGRAAQNFKEEHWNVDKRDGESRYRAAYSDYVARSNAYATVTLKPWNDYEEALAKYRNHEADAEVAWRARRDTYNRNRTNWDADLNGGTMVTDLQGAMTKSGEAVVNDKAGYVEMLDMSLPDRYREYCVGKRGTLHCRNMYRDESGADRRIAWKNVDQLDVAYMMLRTKKGWEVDDSNLAKLSLKNNPWSENAAHPFMRELANVEIVAGYKAELYPFADYDKPCSYTASYGCSRLSLGGRTTTATVDYGPVPEEVRKLEKGSVVLIGTYDYPIIINGPVFFDGDVVIRGFVSGQGTIYSGRNIHIVGDIVYRTPSGGSESSYLGTAIKGPPGWPYPNSGGKLQGKDKAGLVADNEKRDLLLLAARGNVIVGDYTSENWQKAANLRWLNREGAVSAVGNTYDDQAIGYGASHRNYLVSDGGSKVGLRRMTVPYATPQYYVGLWEDAVWYYGETVTTNAGSRAFYQCTLGDHVVHGLKQTGDGDDLSSISPVDYTNAGRSGDGFVVPSASRVKATVAANKDAGDVTQIDAVLFAGHGIFGVVGGTNSHTFTLNGAMICRDEGLFPSFDSRFEGAGSPEPKIWLNWDMRIKSDSEGGNPFVAVTPDSSRTTVQRPRFDIRISDWRQE